MASVFKNIITFGAAGRVEAEYEKLQELQDSLEVLHRHIEERRAEVNAVLERLVETKVEALLALKRVREVSQGLSARDRQLSEGQIEGVQLAQVDFSAVEGTLSAGETALNAAQGVGTGISTAAGAWALAAAFGTASTGTPLAALSGGALLNATLAWFGGGSLAVGGGGMVAGTAVLGSMVALPAIALLAVFSHVGASRKIAEMQEEGEKLAEAREACHDLMLRLDLAEKRSLELTVATRKAQVTFESELCEVKRRLYPWGLLSRVFKWVRKLVTGRSFNDAELEEVARLGQVATSFARILDLKVFDMQGEVAQGE